MASLRGATVIWDSEAVTTSGKSAPAYVPSTNVAIFINNEGANSHTFRVQVAESGDDRGGLNEFDSTDLPDGGLIWYDYYEKDISTPADIVVAGTLKVCIDLSQFSPQLVRLFCTTAVGSNDITAIVASYGPN